MNTPKPARFAIRFLTRSLVALLLLVLGPIPALAQSPWIITNSSPYNLGAKANQLQTEYYRVEQWGFVFTRSTLWHDVWYYPTTELNEAGVFVIDSNNAVSGDFNGDGKKDLMMNWAVIPHVIERPLIAPSVLLNNGSGGLTLSPSAWVNGIGPARLFSFRTGVADFNHDGADDFVAGSFGLGKPMGMGWIWIANEPIPLALSSGDGRLFDATTHIAGQEGGTVVPGFVSAHDLAIGDFNGDGHKDFYQDRVLFLNAGTGRFTPRQDLLPPEAKPDCTRVFASASADLDNDGVDDLVVAYADHPWCGPTISGYIVLSNGTGGIAHGRKILLPSGLFGLENTKPNFTTICDLNRDGLRDIVIAQTRANPHYAGRTLQVLMNKGNGQFVDESARRIVGDDRRDLPDNGEGVLYCLDVNGDGYVDLFDSLGGPFVNNFNRAFLNNGRGVFHAMPSAIIPIVHPYHMRGQEHFEGQPYGTSNHYQLIPIDLNGDGRVSFVAVHNHNLDHPPPQQPGDVSDATYYLIRNIKPYKPVTLRTVGDFDGDGRSDIAVYRNGGWFILRSLDGGVTATGWGGLAQDVPVPGDYDGDGRIDVAVYRDGMWFTLRSSDGAQRAVSWGTVGDVPVQADYDGDGKTDQAVYRSGAWFIQRSSDGVQTMVVWGGLAQDVPVPGDYDGDGRTDIAVYRKSNGGWYILRSSDGGVTVTGWGGLAQDIPVPGDYDGDGKTDIALYRDGGWYVLRSSDGGSTAVGWGGLAQDKPVPADYDGDGMTDVAVYRDGVWLIIRSFDGAVTGTGWGGLAQDIPLN